MDALLRADHIAAYRTSLERLMPKGFAWNPHKGSVQYAWLHTLASEFNSFEQFTYRTIKQFYPYSTCNRLDEWLRSTGLPDACFPNATRAELRQQMMARFGGLTGLAYDDSSPAATESVKTLCAQIGYDVDVWYNTPFRCGRNRVGDRLGMLNGVLNVRVNRVSTPFRVGISRVGDRLVTATKTGDDLVCYLRSIIHARFSIRVIFNEV